MSGKKTQLNCVKSTRQQRVGRVTIYLRGKIWYLYYCENGRRVRRRVGILLADAQRLAAQVNGQLASHTPAFPIFSAGFSAPFTAKLAQLSRAGIAIDAGYHPSLSSGN